MQGLDPSILVVIVGVGFLTFVKPLKVILNNDQRFKYESFQLEFLLINGRAV